MGSELVSSGFKGSDTDELDRIVKTMQEAAQYADLIAKALELICKALDAMSWTGYAAALAAYLRGVVIPLLKAVAANLRAFAQIVSIASTAQKTASGNTDRPTIDTGDKGYTPTPIAAPAATPAPSAPAVSVQQPGTVGAVTPTTDRISTIAGDVGELIKDIKDFLGIAGTDNPTLGTAGAALGKLGEILTDLQKIAGGGTDGTPTAPTTPPTSTPPATDGSSPTTPTTPGATPSPAPTPTPTTPGGTAPTVPGAGTTPVFDPHALWTKINDALAELGITPPGSGTDGGTVTPGGTGGTSGPSPLISADVAGVQSALDKLKTDLGITDTGSGTGGTYAPDGSGTAPTTPTTPDGSLTPSTGYQPDTGGGTGGGSGGGTGGGSGSGSQPTQTAAVPTYVAGTPIPVGSGVPATPTAGAAETRLVGMSTSAPGGGAAIPLSTAAVAASLLGGVFARKAARKDDQDEPGADAAVPVQQQYTA